MALTNQQYDKIQRDYELRRNFHIREMLAKKERAYEQFPRLDEIDDEVVSLNMSRMYATLGQPRRENAVAAEDVDAALEELYMERRALLSAAGFKNGLIEPDYDCPICRDTGYADGRKCSCFMKAATDLICTTSGLNDIIKKENFDTFCLDYYSARIIDPDNGRSAREAARNAYEYSKYFTEHFREENANICFYGKTGVGKTFLAHCIAGALIGRGVNVLWLIESDLIELFEDDQFRTTDETRAEVRLVLDCDLLVIDDFGSNQNNSFISSALLRCIEERHLASKSTIITTNLSIEDLQDRYSDRIFSRIYSYYKKIYLFGDDLRIRH